MDIISQRLSNQGLNQAKFTTSQEVVSFLGAVQSQDFPAAKWSLGARIPGSTNESIEKAYNDGLILRTHVMRPTWHFVAPKDIRWMLRLTSPRVKQQMNHYSSHLELTDETLSKCNSILTKAFEKEKYLTREELSQKLEENNITAKIQRLAHIVMNAELDGVVCSGPKIGNKLTYAYLEDRAPKTKDISRDEALFRLARIYFTSHGPALIKDFVWWSGLTTKDALIALDSIKSQLESITEDNKTYWFSRNQPHATSKPQSLLLSVFDEYFIGYTDRSIILDKENSKTMPAVGNALLTSLLFIDGRVEGTWKRKIKKDTATIKLNLFKKLDKSQQESVEKNAEEYGKFFNLKAVLE